MQVRTPLLIVMSLLVATGCRTYGGYGSEEASFTQIQSALERYEAQSQRMQGDAEALAAAVGDNAALAGQAGRLAALVADQEALLEFHRAQAASVTESSSYRDLSRALGAMLTEQQVIDDRYRRLVADLMARPDLAREDPSRYTVVPAALQRLESSLADVSVREAVRAGS